MKSKLTLHANRAADQTIEFVRVAQPRGLIVLPIDDTAFVERLVAASPNTDLYGRHFDNDAPVERPQWVADKFWEAITSKPAFQRGLIKKWFGPNEINTTAGDNIYGLLEIDYILGSRFRDAGHEYYMLSTSERQPPDVDNWNWTRDPRFRRTAEVCHGYCVHAYWWPRLEDPPGDPLRHQRWYGELPPELRKPVIIKESGPDAGVVSLHHQGWFSAYDGDPHYAMRDFAKWDRLMRADPAVEFVAIYQAGDQMTWYDFDIARSPELMGLLTDHVRTDWPEEVPVLPEWIVDVRDQVAFDSGRTRDRLRGITVHHSASRILIAQYLEAIKRLTTVSYHFLLDDQIYYLNGLEEVVWHAGDGANGPWNTAGVAVCFHGLLTGQGQPTQIQLNHFCRLRSWLLQQGVGDAIVSHKAVRIPPGSTQCPGDWWPLGASIPRILLPLEPCPGPSPGLTERIQWIEETLGDMARTLEHWR